jgi:hypothetical protein
MTKVEKLKKAYEKAKNARVGERCICPSCETPFTKGSYQQVFCKTKAGSKCKDFYWNNVIETKRKNVERISPANESFVLGRQYDRVGFDQNIDDDQSWEAHKNSF